MKTFLLLSWLLLATLCAQGAQRAGGSYEVPHETMDAGGGPQTGLVYQNQGSIGASGFSILAGDGSNPIVTASFASADKAPVAATGYLAGGKTVSLSLGFAPPVGTDLTVVDNTGLDFIQGEFGNLTHGQVVVLAHGGQSYRFVADYFGGTGNDLVLRWGIQRLVGWGANPEGQIGDGSLIHRTVPMPAGNTGALAGKFILSLASGNSHSLALCSDGTLAAWGNNSQGQLGNGTTTRSPTPVAVDMSGALAGKRVVAVSAGIGDSLALCSDGTVYAWGVLKGQASATSPTPVAVDMSGALAGKTVVAIAAGGYHNLVLCSDGSLFAWGADQFGVLGNMDIIEYQQSAVAVPVQDVNSAFNGRAPVSISAGVSHNLVLCDDGVLVAWGMNETTGAVGDGSNLNRHVPVLVDMSGALAGKTVVQALAGGRSSLAVCADGTLAAWGYWNDTVGNGIQNTERTPVALNSFGALAGGAVVAAARGSLNGVALLENGTLAAWGNSQYGGLGNGTATTLTTVWELLPVAVSRVSLAAGEVLGRPVSGGAVQHAFVLGGAGGYVDAPGQVAFDTDSVEVFPGAAHAFVTVTRTGGAAATSVTLSTSDGSAGAVPPFAAALAGTDYEALSTVVEFAEGETSKVVPLTLLPRTGTLPNRRFTVSLSAPAGGASLGALTSTEVRLLAPDSRPPTLAVRFPAATTTFITRVAPLLINGTAGDAHGLDRVEIDYGGSTFTATLGLASKPTLVPWSFELTPTGDGPVSLVIRAYDLSGNATTLTRGFSFIRRYPVEVTRQMPAGLGTPDEAGTVRLISSKGDFSALLPTKGAVTQTGAVVPLAQVTLTPRAMAGYAFSHWEGLPAGTSISGAMANFQMPAEDVTGICAVFVTNPFLGLGARPVFYGLIEPTESTGHSNATHGSLTATLVPGSGSLTGKIHLNGHTTAFTGLALGNGNVWFRAPDKSLHTSLDLPGDSIMTGRFESGQFLVEISDGGNTLGGLALAAAYSKTLLVPAALLNSAGLGFYTAAMPSKAQTPAMELSAYPQGTGYGSFTLKNNGTLRFAGVLADGSKFTAASALVAADLAPLHAQLLTPGTSTGKKGGSLLGHAQFDPDGEHTDVAGMDLRWFRPAVTEQSGTTATALATQLYTDGWPEGIVLDLIGAKYDKAATTQTTLGLTGPGQLTFNDSKLVAEVEFANFSVSGNSVIKTPSTDKSYTLSFTQSSGLMKGTFTPNWDNPAAKLPGFTGVLLGKGANRGGWGFFLSNRAGDLDPEGGRVLLEQP